MTQHKLMGFGVLKVNEFSVWPLKDCYENRFRSIFIPTGCPRRGLADRAETEDARTETGRWICRQ